MWSEQSNPENLSHTKSRVDSYTHVNHRSKDREIRLAHRQVERPSSHSAPSLQSNASHAHSLAWFAEFRPHRSGALIRDIIHAIITLSQPGKYNNTQIHEDVIGKALFNEQLPPIEFSRLLRILTMDDPNPQADMVPLTAILNMYPTNDGRPAFKFRPDFMKLVKKAKAMDLRLSDGSLERLVMAQLGPSLN
jgi:hypothetical protein